MLDTGATRSFISNTFADKLNADVHNVEPLTVTLPTGRQLVTNKAVQLDMLIDDFGYT